MSKEIDKTKDQLYKLKNENTCQYERLVWLKERRDKLAIKLKSKLDQEEEILNAFMNEDKVTKNLDP